MRKILLATLLALTGPAAADAAWIGKLDLLDRSLPEPIGLRELNDGNWLAGVQKQLWHLEKDKSELFHVSYFHAWRTFQGDAAYGLALGLNTGRLGEAIESAVSLAAPDVKRIKWLSTISNWVSLQTFAGYRPFHGSDTHDFVYGIGGKVRIPLDLNRGL